MRRVAAAAAVLGLSLLTIGCGQRWVKVPTGAMQPTIEIGADVIVDETAYASGQAVERFDLVLHKAPVNDDTKKMGFDENTRFIFRVVGLSGEKVELKKGKVFINDRLLDEPFEKYSSDDDFGPIVVPASEFFLLGDNRPDSFDSRYWKPATIKREAILGKAVKIF